MTDRPTLPPGIGPHEGRELDLMLSGEKPLALFCDVVPSAFDWPDAQFAPHVAAGRIVAREFWTDGPDDAHRVRHLYYAQPDEAWRIERAHALVTASFDSWGPEAAAACADLGRLLGYREADIQAFLDWSDRNVGRLR
ncbi:hemin receptor [Roseospira marina]|uniref:Hemin receptor n=1 Tax=Roseospira marina TaxID=140057 RepID=A0A5M6IEQ3_9PROT|nr:hemin receptor [Roseospira marina]KAA5606457.1 hemin receptor [Roseospira marina]MBB4314127.1 hypothetical protein [Roseospira marina]MBB5087288.1 hypothetical protein [Roseospira marina]